MAQWLGFGAFPDPAPVQTLLRELRSLKLHSTATNKQKRNEKRISVPCMCRERVRAEVITRPRPRPHRGWGSLGSELPQPPRGGSTSGEPRLRDVKPQD